MKGQFGLEDYNFLSLKCNDLTYSFCMFFFSILNSFTLTINAKNNRKKHVAHQLAYSIKSHLVHTTHIFYTVTELKKNQPKYCKLCFGRFTSFKTARKIKLINGIIYRKNCIKRYR